MITPDMMLTMTVDDHSSNKVTAIPISNTNTAPATVKEGNNNFSTKPVVPTKNDQKDYAEEVQFGNGMQKKDFEVETWAPRYKAKLP